LESVGSHDAEKRRCGCQAEPIDDFDNLIIVGYKQALPSDDMSVESAMMSGIAQECVTSMVMPRRAATDDSLILQIYAKEEQGDHINHAGTRLASH
jgi:hypothetical protein